MSGLFVTFEGGEGSGKSSQIKALVQRLANHHPDQEIIVTREPGGTGPAEEIRAILVNGEHDKITPQTEALLMVAARTENVDKVIKPALLRNAVVLCDRFADSSRVYQALALGQTIEKVDQLHQFGFDNLHPDITFYLDVEPEIGLARAHSRISENNNKNHNIESRFEEKGLGFHRAVREGFLTLAAQYSDRFCVINAAQSEGDVSRDIWQVLSRRLADIALQAEA